METAVLWANLLLNLWLLIIVYRSGVRKQLRWFALYMLWEVLSGAAELAAWLVGRQFYAPLYWWMETIEIALIVGAVRESFLRIFQGFTKIRGFRWMVWGVIGGVVIYSAWKAIFAPPIQHNKFGVFVLEAEFLFRWGVLGIALLAAIMGAILLGRLNSREDAVVTGFGVACAGFLAYIGMVSIFGNKYIFFAQYLPSVGYFVAVGWWIWVFSRPEEEFGFKELGMGPEDIRRKLREYRERSEEMMREKP